MKTWMAAFLVCGSLLAVPHRDARGETPDQRLSSAAKQINKVVKSRFGNQGVKALGLNMKQSQKSQADKSVSAIQKGPGFIRQVHDIKDADVHIITATNKDA